MQDLSRVGHSGGGMHFGSSEDTSHFVHDHDTHELAPASELDPAFSEIFTTPVIPVWRSSQTIRHPIKYNDYVAYLVYHYLLETVAKVPEPETYEETVLNPHWGVAMDSEK